MKKKNKIHFSSYCSYAGDASTQFETGKFNQDVICKHDPVFWQGFVFSFVILFFTKQHDETAYFI
jgi:hypothetical protein